MTGTTSDPATAAPPLAGAFVAALRDVLGTPDAPLPLHEPDLSGRERDYVLECIDTGWVSSVGGFVTRFEALLAETAGVRRAVAVVNGTAALHTCLLASGVRPGDEVLIPTLTFVATANAVAHCGALPHFVDSEERTLGVDPAKLGAHLARIAERRADGTYNRETGRRIAAVVPVHIFGHPVDMDPLVELCAEYDLPLIEDATESLGSTYKGRACGGLSRLAALSFNGNKIVTTGGGGAILTDDEALADRIRHVTTTGKIPHRWRFDHDVVAYNYRLTNLAAALGVAQLERLESFLAAKRRLAEAYGAAFEGLSGLRLFKECAFARGNHWLVAALLDRPDEALLESLLEASNAAGFMTRPAWTPMHRLPMYAECPRMDLTVSEELASRIINLPSGMGAARRVA